MHVQTPNYKYDPYKGTAEISLKSTEGLFATIKTKRLLIRSILQSDFENYHSKLYSDPEVMAKVSYGITKSWQTTKERIEKVWLKRWEMGSPFSAMAIFDQESGNFVGHIMLRDCKIPGVTEIHYLLSKHEQRKGFGMEAASAVIYEFLPKLIQESFLMHGKRIEKVIGTARFDNVGSVKILEALLEHEKDEIKYNELRKFYSLELNF